MNGYSDDLRDLARRNQAELAYHRERNRELESELRHVRGELHQSLQRETDACKREAQAYRESAEFLREVSGRWLKAEGMVEGFRGMLSGREEVLRALPAPQPKPKVSALDEFIEGATFGLYKAPR